MLARFKHGKVITFCHLGEGEGIKDQPLRTPRPSCHPISKGLDRDRHKLWWVRPLYPSFPAWPVPMRRRTVGIVYTRAGGPTRRSATQRCGGVGSGRDMTTLFSKKRLPLLSNAGVAALSTQAESAADSSWSHQAATGIRHSVSTSNSERCARRGS